MFPQSNKFRCLKGSKQFNFTKFKKLWRIKTCTLKNIYQKDKKQAKLGKRKWYNYGDKCHISSKYPYEKGLKRDDNIKLICKNG